MFTYIKSIFILAIYNPRLGFNLLSYFLMILSFFTFLLLKSKRYLHMLQLNSYYNLRFFKWLIRNLSFITDRDEFIIFLMIPISIFSTPLIFSMLMIGVFIYLSTKLFFKKEKKEFKFTARAIRIFLISSIFNFFIILGAAYYFFSMLKYFAINYSFFISLILSFISLLLFSVLMLSNFALFPLEKLIQNYYKNDAKRKIRGLKNLKIIGITGSYGKTSTKYILKELLSEKFNTFMTPASVNTAMGLTKTIREFLNPTYEIFIAEMGAREIGNIKELCEIASPKFAIITEIGPQHIETFSSIENIKKTKFEILDALPKDGVAFLNIGNVNLNQKSKEIENKVVTFSINFDSDFKASNVKVDEDGTTFDLEVKGKTYQLKTSLLGDHNVLNILAAMSVASYLGLEINYLIDQVKKIKQVPNRLEIIRRERGIIVINDSFNSNIVGAKKAVDVLRNIEGNRKILVTPGIIEGGKSQEDLNKEFIKYASSSCDYIIIVGYLNKRIIEKALYEIQYPKGRVFYSKDLEEAKKELNRYLEAKDVVLFENDLPDNYN